MTTATSELDREIIGLLCNDEKLTVPKIAKLLNANKGSVEYHLKSLVERNIVNVIEKSYGSKYFLSEEYATKLSVGNRALWLFVGALVLLVSGVLTIPSRPYLSVALLTGSSVIGTASIIHKIVMQRKEKIKNLLQLL